MNNCKKRNGRVVKFNVDKNQKFTLEKLAFIMAGSFESLLKEPSSVPLDEE